MARLDHNLVGDSMVNPTVDNLVSYYEGLASISSPNIEKQAVHHADSWSVFMYERVRNIIDNKSEHLIRRNAIERIIRRLLWENPRIDAAATAQSLIRELIWARFLISNVLSTSQEVNLKQVLEKYFALLRATTNFDFVSKTQAGQVRADILALISAELEEIIDLEIKKNNSWCTFMLAQFKTSYDWEDDLPEEEKKLQEFIAIHRSLVKSDNARIYFQVTSLVFPKWRDMTVKEAVEVLPDLVGLLIKSRQIMASDVQAKLYRFVLKQTPPFFLLRAVIEDHPDKAKVVLSNPGLLTEKIKQICALRYKDINRRMTSGLIRSTLYILVTKIVLVLALEVPFELFTAQSVNVIPLVANLLIPPGCMIALGATIRKPREKNTQLLTQRVFNLVYVNNQTTTRFSLVSPNSRSTLTWFFNVLLSAFFLMIFGVIILLLGFLHFNVLNIVVFFLFLSLILLFGYRISYTAMELNVEDNDGGFFARVLSELTLPFLRLGVWLSKALGQLNFITIIMDILIEMPLKTFVEIGQEWSQFVKEKKAEMVEVPIQ